MHSRFLIALLGVCAFAADPPITESNCTAFRLENGMRWTVCERAGTGKVTAITYATVGTAHEKPGKTGTLQVLRAMMTRHARAAGFKEAFAMTNHDRFIVSNTTAPAELEAWLQYEAKRIPSPDMTGFDGAKAEFADMWKKRDASGSWLLWEYTRAAFLSHPYGQPDTGFIEDLEQLQRTDVESFYRDHLAPVNLIGVIVGDVKTAEVRPRVEALFGKLARGAVTPALTIREPQQRTERRIIGAPGPGVLLIGYHKPSIADSRAPAWSVIVPVLNKRLKAELVERDKLASRADVFLGPAMKYAGLVTTLAFLAPGADLGKLEAGLHAQFERLRAEPLTAEELAAVRPTGTPGSSNARSDHFAIDLADWESMTNDWRNIFRHTEQTRSVTAEEIQRIARETFVPTGRTVAVVPVAAR